MLLPAGGVRSVRQRRDPLPVLMPLQSEPTSKLFSMSSRRKAQPLACSPVPHRSPPVRPHQKCLTHLGIRLPGGQSSLVATLRSHMTRAYSRHGPLIHCWKEQCRAVERVGLKTLILEKLHLTSAWVSLC